MLTIFQRVYKFNQDAGTELGQKELDLRTAVNEVQMLEEEVDELKIALFKGIEWQFGRNKDEPLLRTFRLKDELDRTEIADALGDIIYVAMGTMAKLGIDYEAVMNEICSSNESKYTDGVLIKNGVGKIQKGPNFRRPDLSFVSKPIKISFTYDTSDSSTDAVKVTVISS